tara:strand:+ start:977 stop:1594 length:618 start_codon:yes stop_codon:yes gene_type:complete
MIAFLHTSKVHVDRFEKLVQLIDGNRTTKHYVQEDLLEYALTNERTNSLAFRDQVDAIKKDNPSVIICTCSTYGEECDQLDGVYRIDRPIVQYIISKYQKIGLVYTVNSTKEISTNLLFATAKQLGVKIEIVNCDCSKHWIHFESGNQEKYEKQIATSIKSIEDDVDVVFLAQASMESVKKNLSNFNKEIFSSPEYGVRNLLQTL